MFEKRKRQALPYIDVKAKGDGFPSPFALDVWESY
jgi:hypothetical protein